jgi:poly(3-hydroxybutyrate) depolymerase
VDLPNLDKWDKSTVRYHQYDGGLNNSRVGMYQVSGGGHATPSRAERYAFVWELIVGRQNHDIECADAIWNFFQGG